MFRDFHPENSLFRETTVTDIFVCFRPPAWAQTNPPCPMRQTKPALSPQKIEKIESKPPSQTVVGAVHAHQILILELTCVETNLIVSDPVTLFSL